MPKRACRRDTGSTRRLLLIGETEPWGHRLRRPYLAYWRCLRCQRRNKGWEK